MNPAPPTVLLTGASGAYAAHVAEAFRARGYLVVGVSRQKALPADRFDIHIRADVSDDDSIAAISGTLERNGVRVSVLVAAAGQRAPTDHLANLTGAELLDLFNVHCVSTLRALKGAWTSRAVPLRLVAITSRFSSFGLHLQGAFSNYRPLYSYSVAKTALNMLCMRLRAEHPPDAIRLYLVHPGRLTVGVSATDACDDPAVSAKRLVEYVERTPGDVLQLYDLMQEAVIPW